MRHIVPTTPSRPLLSPRDHHIQTHETLCRATLGGLNIYIYTEREREREREFSPPDTPVSTHLGHCFFTLYAHCAWMIFNGSAQNFLLDAKRVSKAVTRDS